MPTTFAKLGDNKGGDPNIMKLEATNKVRPLDNSVAEWKQHTIENPNDPEQVQMVVCPGPRTCPLCRKPADPKGEPYFPVSRRFGVCVWDYASNAVKVLIAGPQVFDEFKTAAKLSIEPSSCDWTIVKEGIKRSTKYQVVRHNAEPGPQITPEQLLDIAKYEAPDSVERIFEILEQYGIDYDALPIPHFTLDEALAFTMPYTTHKGLTIEKLLETDDSFAQWLHGTKLEQGALGDPVFLALQVALEARGQAQPLDDALASLPEPESAAPAPAAQAAAPATPAAAPASETPGLPEPAAGEVRLLAVNGIPVNVPESSVDSLLAAGFTRPEPPAPEAEAAAPDENTPTKVRINGQEVVLPRIEAVKLVSYGSAEYVEEGAPAAAATPEPEPPKLPLPDEEVQVDINGTPVTMIYAQAGALVDSGTATFADMEIGAAHQRVKDELEQKLQDKADQQSVAEQAAAEQANPTSVPPAADPEATNICPHCNKGYKSKGGLTQHINREHAGAAPPAQSQPAAPAPAAQAAAPATPAAAPATGSDADGAVRERVKTKIASSPFARDYSRMLDIFREETGKANVMEMNEAELLKLESRVDAEAAKG